jgi:peptidoglycan hydrolase CwlO-like protein
MRLARNLFLSLLLSFALVYFYSAVQAESDQVDPPLSEEEDITEIQSEYDEVKAEIEKYERQLNSLVSKERTLANQIQQFESQIQLTALQITKTEAEIVQLKEEIDYLQFEVDDLEISLEKIALDIAERVVYRYQLGSVTPLQLFVKSNGIDQYVTRYAYLSYVEKQERQKLLELQKSQSMVTDIKLEREDKQAEVEEKKEQLQKLSQTLNSQKIAKENLLQVTRNDEARYRQLLEAARSREEQLAKLVFRDGKVSYTLGIFNLVKSRQVGRGERIGTMGNSGYPRCSTAAHLHFEVIENAQVTSSALTGDLINPQAYLQSRDLSYFRNNDTIDVKRFGAGSYAWPMSTPVITQEFGQTPWSSRYTNNFHTGIDMVDYNDYAVRAADSGTLYYAKIPCGNAINIAIVAHTADKATVYLHLK